MLRLVDIKKHYNMGDGNIVKALDGVNIEINQGEFVCIIGPSGSGKSTMMNILGCLDVASEGKYFVDDVEISKFSEDQLASLRNDKIGFIFQGFNLLPRLTAFENVELPLIYQGKNAKERKEIVVKALEMVGMDDRKNHRPSELSGGQQQRVAIARALATHPKVILADEPTGNLDSKSGEDVMNILRRLNREQGVTIAVITHNVEIANLSERIVKIFDGKIVEDVKVKTDKSKTKAKRTDKREESNL